MNFGECVDRARSVLPDKGFSILRVLLAMVQGCGNNRGDVICNGLQKEVDKGYVSDRVVTLGKGPH